MISTHLAVKHIKLSIDTNVINQLIPYYDSARRLSCVWFVCGSETNQPLRHAQFILRVLLITEIQM